MHRGNINFQFLMEAYLLNTPVTNNYWVLSHKGYFFIHQTNFKSGNFNEFF